jgi:arylsulfatase
MAASALSATGLVTTAQAQQQQPAAVGAYHRGIMASRMPNLDKLASERMLFTDYCAEASCTAERAPLSTLPVPNGKSTAQHTPS